MSNVLELFGEITLDAKGREWEVIGAATPCKFMRII